LFEVGFLESFYPYIRPRLQNKFFMKNIKQQTPNHNTRLSNNKHIPENKDDIDSREHEEQITKGDDKTHNKKERKSEKKSTNK